MFIKILVFVVLAQTVNAQSRNLTVEYYESFINHETADAFVYQLPKNAYEYVPNTKRSTVYGRFDYIIVGAGSAGAVIATRLTENQNVNVLLLEAGEHQNTYSDIPGMMIYLQGLRFNWNFKSISQTTCCLGMINNECPYPRGKVVGGTSVINALMYVRGNKDNFDTWARNGNIGWSYKDVLKFFKKSENSQIDGDPGYHGKGGLLNVEYTKPYSPVFYAFLRANIELGQKILDYNGKQQIGAARIQLNSLHGKRESTGRSFLPRTATRSNFKMLTGSYVTKILIKRRSKEAYGVEFSRDGKSYIALASKEVIVSAGAINSPQLLMLSGIGPRKHLRQHNIPVIADLAVGTNLQDHATYYGLYFNSDYTEAMQSTAEYVDEYLDGRGPFTNAANSQGVSFFRTNLTNTPPGVPDVEIIIIPPISVNDFIQKVFQYTNQTYDALWAKLDPSRSFTFYIMLLHPKSRGSVMLRSNNPYDYPLIDANFLSDPWGEDIETIYAGIQLVLKMINTRAFQELNTKLVGATLPACQQYNYHSKAYWYCHIRQLTMHIFHPVGTCKMGPSRDKTAVVDYRLRVHGVKRLRVADASIIPLTISGHINAVAMMIGEKLAYMLQNGV